MTTRRGWKAGLALGLGLGLAVVGLGCGRGDSREDSRDEPEAAAPGPEVAVPPVADTPAAPAPAPVEDRAARPAPTPLPSPPTPPANPEPLPRPPANPEPLPQPPANPEPLPQPPAETVDPDWWQVSPEATPITFEVPACLPAPATTGLRRPIHPCTVKQFAPLGALQRLLRLDDAGRVLEEAHYGEVTQAPTWRELHTYDALGREVQRVTYPSGGPVFGTTEWVYDEAGRLVWIFTDSVRTRYTYNDRGDLVLIENLPKQGTHSSWQRFRYGSRGQLETSWYTDDDYCPAGPTAPESSCGLYARREYTYYPSGRLKQEAHNAIDPMQAMDWKKNFDERGRLVREDVSGDEFGRSTTWSYDERDLRLEEVYSFAGSNGTIEQISRWKYDAAGQLGAERIARTWDLPWAQNPSAGHTVKLQRYFHACGSGKLLFTEQDINEDGTRDGWREELWDAAGRLRLERYYGSLVQDAHLSRVEYDYSCRD